MPPKRNLLRLALPAPRKRLKVVVPLALALLHLYGRLPDVNEIPKPKTTPLDVFVWGTGAMCELGLGPEAKTKEVKRPRKNPFVLPPALGQANGKDIAAVDFAAGGMHTLVLDLENNVWLWGSNDYGVLGRDTLGQDVLKDMDVDDLSDDEDGDLNPAELTPGKVEGLPKLPVVALAATDNVLAVLLSNGDVWAWGCWRNNEGVLGFLRLKDKQRTPIKINELKNIVQMAAGKDHLLAIDTKGIVYAWGNGQQNQLGRKIGARHVYRLLEPQPFGLYNVKYIASGDFHCFAVDHDDQVWLWGLNQYGQCGFEVENLLDGDADPKPRLVEGLLGKKVTQIAGGEHHTLAVTGDGQVLACGRLDMAELGIPEADYPAYTFKDANGKPRSIPQPTPVKIGKAGFKARAVGAGLHQLYAITDDGMVYAWGFGDTYALGLGPVDDDVEVPTRIHNTATKDHDIVHIEGGGQFAISGGYKLADDVAETRLEKYEDDED